jgi:hypothetical protein
MNGMNGGMGPMNDDMSAAMSQSAADYRGRPGIERVAGFGPPGGNTNPPPPVYNPNTSSIRLNENDIGALMGMGFSRDQSAHALINNGCNFERALDRLLSGMN